VVAVIAEYAWLIPVFPFAAFILISLLPKRTLFWEDGAVYGIAGTVLALGMSFAVIWDILQGHTVTTNSPSFTWASHSEYGSTSSPQSC
jgi:NADH:ubiquinone oxidoreductase subunit 5 (subunit L)/multisubunit Na+/H+ antiporter MnhA subunit